MNREKSKGLKTATEGGYYQLSADIGHTINTYNSTFIFAYVLKNEQTTGTVGGAYLKILPEKVQQEALCYEFLPNSSSKVFD